MPKVYQLGVAKLGSISPVAWQRTVSTDRLGGYRRGDLFNVPSDRNLCRGEWFRRER